MARGADIKDFVQRGIHRVARARGAEYLRCAQEGRFNCLETPRVHASHGVPRRKVCVFFRVFSARTAVARAARMRMI